VGAPSATGVCQVCVVARDGAATARWYVHGLGLLPAGRSVFFGRLAERVQALPSPFLHARWALDGQGLFQVEIFQYRSPRSRPRRADWTPADWGYSIVGVHVRDLDAALERLAALGTTPRAPVAGPPGDRRACVPDPDGNLVELYERDPLAEVAPALERPGLPATVRSVTVSVPDLDAFCARAERGLGLAREDLALHGPGHERLWGLEGARRRSTVLRGGGVAIEAVQYEEPSGRPWPGGHRLCDLGYMNVAVGYRDTAEFDRGLSRALGEGWEPHGRLLEAGVFKVVYLDDPDGFDVEMLRPRRWADRLTGFAPRRRGRVARPRRDATRA